MGESSRDEEGVRCTVRSKVIDEIQIVGSEIGATERSAIWNGETCWPAASQGSVEVWCYGQGAREGIVETGDGNCAPYDIDCVVGLVIWLCCLA